MTWRTFLANAFAIPRKPPLSAEDRAISAWVAQELKRRNLDVPAILVVESCQPLAGIAAQLMIFLEPSLSLFMRPVDIGRFREFIEKEGALDDLVGRLQGQPAVEVSDSKSKDQTEANSEPSRLPEASSNSESINSSGDSPSAVSDETTERP